MRNFRGWPLTCPMATSPPLPLTAKIFCGLNGLAVSRPPDAAVISLTDLLGSCTAHVQPPHNSSIALGDLVPVVSHFGDQHSLFLWRLAVVYASLQLAFAILQVMIPLLLHLVQINSLYDC